MDSNASNNNVFHKEHANGKWFELSLCEQLGNIGSEVGRLAKWKKKGNQKFATNAFFRALELLDLTRKDPRWQNHRLKEIGRSREFLCYAYYDEPIYDVDINYLEKYFMDFALAARKHK